MSHLVRKIDKAKWQQRKIKDGEDPSGDAITQCLKTKQNTLSVWRIQKKEELELAIMAMAAAFDHIDKIDVALLDEVALVEKNIKLVENLGDTPFTDMQGIHRDISELTYSSLGTVADEIVSCFVDDGKLRRFTKTSLLKLLTKAISEGKFQASDLKEHVRAKVKEYARLAG